MQGVAQRFHAVIGADDNRGVHGAYTRSDAIWLACLFTGYHIACLPQRTGLNQRAITEKGSFDSRLRLLARAITSTKNDSIN